MAKEKVSRIGVSLPHDLLDCFDQYLEQKGYDNRSKALADLIREAILRQEWEIEGAEVLAAVTIVYDHHTRGLAEKLTGIQHDHSSEIIASTHVHIDHHRCLEIIVLRGKVSDVRHVSDSLTSARGVLHGKVLFAATSQKN